ncbi:MAG: tRNA (adenosine(37)-N6)-threonylcarbamoyltransferase complex ATPase subunit type 1 TsaE [Solirubrobacterales bacterium]|nr:tRNA (adenosine(37)-N6)-threonylcarbamoyltransferase complex ATPase subunit type 1 TsaE [Solirubrobacterales bacterium]
MPAERTASAAETEAFGERLGAGLQPGDVVLVSGEVGAGKTTLIRGACRALGVTDRVTSPTFTIGQRYAGRMPVSHLDLYRLDDIGAEDPALLEDYIDGDSIAFVEWPHRGLPAQRPVQDAESIRVSLRHLGGDEREILLES